MQYSQRARLRALLRIQWFMNHNAQEIGTVNQSRVRRVLDAVVAALEAYAKELHLSAMEAASKTEIKTLLRTELRVLHMHQITVIAQSRLDGVADTPLMSKFRYPDRRVDDEGLVAAGQSMADAAELYEAVFLDEQLPSDFIGQLRAATEKVRLTTAERDGCRLRLRAATEGVVTELQRAKHVVRVLNTLLVRQLRGNVELLSAWSMAKRVRAKPGVARGAEDAATAA